MDKKFYYRIVHNLISIFTIAPILIISISSPAFSTIYYIDSITGKNNNNGISIQNAWKSLAKVNATTCSPGDSILFNCDGLISKNITNYDAKAGY